MPADSPIPGSPAEWLAYARRDLVMAKVELPPGGVYESLCFHAQQAAEKAIKAVYQARGQSFRYTHDIDDLLEGLERMGVSVPDVVWESADLTRFAWEARYLTFGEPVTRAEYECMLAQAERVVHWAAGIIEGGKP